MGWGSLTVDRNAGWQDVHVTTSSPGRPHSLIGWSVWAARQLATLLVWLAVLVAGFTRTNWLVTVAVVTPVLALWAHGLPFAALALVLAVVVAAGLWFWRAPESFDGWVCSPARCWWRRRRYRRKWAGVMVAGRLTVKTPRHKLLAPRLARVRQGRYADVLMVRLPDGITTDRFTTHLPEVAEAMRARDARLVPAPRHRLPSWLRARLAEEFAPGARRPGVVFLRLTFGDALVKTITTTAAGRDAVDFNAVPIGRRDDGSPWCVSLRDTHTLLAGATGAGKASVLWSLIAALGPAIRDGLVQLVGLDPKGGMELGFGRELFRQLVTMDGREAEEQAVAFLEELADEADRRASALAGYARALEPSTAMPFLLVVIDELASVTAFISDSKRRQRAEAALGRLLTKGRAPGIHVIGALQDPRKEVVKWRDLFPTRIALRLVEAGQVDMVLDAGAYERGARCELIPETTPGVGYVLEPGSTAVTRVRSAYLTDADIRALAQQFRPGPVLHAVEGGVA